MKDFELMIKQSLHDATDNIQADDALKERVDFMLTKQKKTISFKKIAVGLVAVACIATVGAVARGQIAGFSSSVDKSDGFENISEFNKHVVSISKEISLPESISGNKFTFGTIDKVNKLDDEMKEIGYFTEAFAEYDGLSVTAHKYDPEVDENVDPTEKNVEEKNINGITVKYSTSDYLFVPADYKLTDEEQKRMENNEINVSYGTDKKIESTSSYVSWKDGDIVYSVLSLDGLDSDAMFSAAQQIINN